ncbi:MAG: GNAT family N-acetyltransferase [Pseudomonadota bacterium]
MRLRAPEPHEAPALTEMVMRSKASWGYDAAFMEACRDVLTVHADAWGLPQLAEEDQILGYVEIHPDELKLNHLFIAPEAQGKGVGSRLLSWAMDTARAEALPYLTLVADPNAEPFYARYGWEIVGTTPSEVAKDRPLSVMKFTF